MNSYKLTQTAAELQADLNKVEGLAEIKSVGTGLNLDSSTGALTSTGVASIGGKIGAISLGSGLNINNSNQMSNTGVISIGGKTGTFTLGTGLSVNSSNVLSCTINGISYSIVNELPASGVNGTIYLVPLTSSTTNNAYREFIYANNAWEQIGTTEVDLSDYYTKTQTDTLLGGKQNSLNTPAGSGLTLAPSTIPNMVDIKMTAFTSTDVTLNETGYATVTYNITNGSAIGPSTVYARPTGGPTITIGIASSIGYALPMSVTVTNATYTYDNTTGIITAQPTGDMVVTATCVVPVTITYNITNGTSDGPATVRTGDTLSFNITPSSGYGYPTTITVTGLGPLDYTYNSSTGVFTAFPVGSNNITITAECTAPAGLVVPAGSLLVLYDADNHWPYTAGSMDVGVYKGTSWASSQPASYVGDTITCEDDGSISGHKIVDISSLLNTSGSMLMTRVGTWYDVDSYIFGQAREEWQYVYIFEDGQKVFSDQDIANMKAGTNKLTANYSVYNPGSTFGWDTNCTFNGYTHTMTANTVMVIVLNYLASD